MHFKKHLKIENDLYFKDGLHLGFQKDSKDDIYLGSRKDFEDDFDLIAAFYFDRLDHGGQSTSICEYLFPFLDKIKKKDWPKEYNGEWYCVMSILESYQLIESGVSIRCPWLTNIGNECYEDISSILTKSLDFSAIKKGMTMLEIVEAYPEIVAKFIEKRFAEFEKVGELSGKANV